MKTNTKGIFSKWEKVNQKPKPPQVRTVSQKKVNQMVRLLFIVILSVFIYLGVSAYQANLKVEKLTTEMNQAMRVLNDNQDQLTKRLNELTKKEVKVKKGGE